MDPLYAEFAKYGVAGLLMAVICSVMVLLLRTQVSAAQKNAADSLQLVRDQIDERKNDLTWARAELAASRHDFVKALEQTNAANLTVLARVEQRWEKTTDSICERLEQIEKRLNA